MKFCRLAVCFALAQCLSAHAEDTDSGKKGFISHCGGCHSIDPVINHYAPNLHCIVHRQAGVANYSGYSADFKKSTTDLLWTKDMLFAYLAKLSRTQTVNA